MFLGKGVLEICSKSTEKHQCQSAISTKLLCNVIEIALRHGSSHLNLLHILRKPFSKNTSGWLLLDFIYIRNLLSFLLLILYNRVSCVYFFLKKSFSKQPPVSIFSWKTLFLKAGLECQILNTVSTDFSKILQTFFVKLCRFFFLFFCILLVHTKFIFFI